MALWTNPFESYEGWGTWQDGLDNHKQLMETGAFICKILFRNIDGSEVGTPETPIIITIYDDSTSSSPRKIIWKSGDDEIFYPNKDSVKVLVNDVELTQTYSFETIQYDTEFYVEIQNNLIGYQDNVSIYFNKGFNTSGKTISYLYTTRGKSVDQYNLQPKDDLVSFRSVYGYTQYLDPVFKYRGISYPNSLLISFPVTPPFDTRFSQLGISEEWQNRGWSLGDVKLHEFDIVYRLSDQRYYEICNIDYNVLMYKGEWKLMTQSFEIRQLAKTDIIRQFTIV